MMRAAIAIILLLSSAGMTMAANPTTSPTGEFASAANALASDLYAHVRTVDGNQCISPFSVSTALAMTSVGARGLTESQMLGVLHWTGRADELPDDVAALSALVTPPSDHSKATANGDVRGRMPAPVVSICNSLWGAAGLTYEPAFQNIVTRDFGAALHETDFSADPETARGQINAWASDATHKKIPAALPAGAINRATKLVLVNAVYFKANWAETFNIAATKDQPFHFITGSDATVPTMHQRGHFRYAENDQLQLIELPYTSAFSMVILLPRKVNGVKEMESAFSAESLGNLLAASGNNLVDVSLPRFKMNRQYDLTGPLQAMGMKDACTNAADFSGLTTSQKLKIDQVSHSTFIAVDEHGTEAAAVSSVIMRATAMRPRPEEPKNFRADHPFVFAIRHNQTGVILFIGRVADPR